MRMGRASGRCDECAERASDEEGECSARERANVSHNTFEKKSMRGTLGRSAQEWPKGVSGHWVRECVEYGTNERCGARLVIPT